ncbi:MAG TPA: GlsB/YeaQ/YmgE family stress response membrane protein [Allosphingosinicella sp.]|nr:GlsB/YeaQ/YmgE family stress response membrane protein [Allosphingosinicella sp.]
MNLLIALVIGGIIGWLASIVMRTNAQQGIILNVVVGIIGSLLGSFLLGPLFGAEGNIMNGNALDIKTLLAAFVGALILLAIVNLFRRGSVR